ncbi:MAG TPA: MG2 domain-containing protein [Kofleriaceae bacterium]|nr:MG2 domain-containing protein [Kofleriaceae bacterium]
MRHLRSLVPSVGAAALLLSCRGQPVSAPRADDPVVVVPPDAPSPMQQRLAAMKPVTGPANPTLEAAIDAFQARTKPRRGYIAVDKPLYQPGEIIWFRAFDLASADFAAGDKDAVTFQLVSPRGSKVAEKRVLLDGGAAANDFALAGGLPGGEYTLSGQSDHGTKYERKIIVSSYEPPRIKKKLEFLRKAYGPGDTVLATVGLHRATGEALAKKQATAVVTVDGADVARVPVTTDGDGNTVVKFALPSQIQKGDGLLTILVDDGGVTESIQKRIPITLADLRFTAYPEGGDLVAGLPSRVYFQAKNLLDKPADIEGKVVDDRGRTVALLRSYHDGLGRFDLHPEPDRSYKVQITKPSGIAKTFPLPAAHDHGCTMQTLDDYGSTRADLRVGVWCTSAREVVVSAMLRDRRIASATANVQAGAPTLISLPIVTAAQGALRVTLFDGKLAPLAERLVYRHRGRDLKITVKPDRASYHPRDRVQLAIETTAPDGKPVAADLAVSVVDDTVLAFADDKQATMLARMYLEAELPGQKIEEPNFYFGTDPKAPAGLDLVMGTHGWRRFDWKPVFEAPPKPPITQPWTFTGDYWNQPTRRQPVRLANKGKQGKDKAVGAADLPPPEAVEDAKVVKLHAAKAPPAPRNFEQVLAAQPPPAIDGAPPAPPPMVAGRVMAERMPMRVQADAMDEDFGGEAEGEVMVIQAAGGRANRFHRQGFDLGDEADRRKHQIRDRMRDEQPEVAADPLCCLEPERQFPLPTYDAHYDGPRTDFRETVYWNAHVATDATGKGTIAFSLSDAVTSFKVTAEGRAGDVIGRGEAEVQSKKPVSLAVKLPLEAQQGDTIKLPVTIANETDEPYTATIATSFGKAFKVSGSLAPQLQLAAHESRSAFFELAVVGDGDVAEDGKIKISVEAAQLRDEVERTIKIGTVGFPQEVSLAGTLEKGTTARHEITITDVIPDTMDGKLALYPSPLATMVKGTEAMIAEPGGCFEQASSTNYPNVMILGYLEQHRAADPAIVERASKFLDKGYDLLTGYETKTKGYEWFGGDPGHEALTAYGLMEFRDMAKVYKGVDPAMVERTRQWLRNRRDGKGGYQTNPRALDSFGRASPEVTDAYITYALTEAGETGIDEELARQRDMAATTKDAYILALATGALVNAQPKSESTRAAVGRLVAMQAKDGSFPGADHSITRSGGEALTIETTALATLALLKAGNHTAEVRRAVEWIDKQRSGNGAYGSTQSTVLSLKALAAYANESGKTDAEGVVTVLVNGKQVSRIPYEKGHQGAIEIPIVQFLKPGKNVIEMQLDSSASLPYSGLVTWGSKVPATSSQVKVGLATHLAKSAVKLGEGVRLDVKVTNTTDRGVPMTLARVGLPGGLTSQTWQLKELRDKGLIDFYETRPREVILYFRSLPPKAVKDVPLDLIASTPGTFTAPASRAYLYYTAEHKVWVAPSSVTVTP